MRWVARWLGESYSTMMCPPGGTIERELFEERQVKAGRAEVDYIVAHVQHLAVVREFDPVEGGKRS